MLQERMSGSKRAAKADYRHGRSAGTLSSYVKESKRRNKQMLNRRVRHADVLGGCGAYRKLARDAAYQYID